LATFEKSENSQREKHFKLGRLQLGYSRVS
jgi:hypothetical protein